MVKQDCQKTAEQLCKMQLMNGGQDDIQQKTQWLLWSAIAVLMEYLGNMSEIKMKKLILISSLLISSFSFGADWGLVGESNNIKHYYDIDSVKLIGEHQFEFWEKHVGKTENRVIRAKVDCVNDIYTMIDAYKYRGEDVVEAITNQDYKLNPPPGSAAYLIVERVCNYGTSLEIERLNLPKKGDYEDEVEYHLARFFAFGFQDYVPTESMMNEYFDLMSSFQSERKVYKEIIKILEGVDYLKVKYIDLKK